MPPHPLGIYQTTKSGNILLEAGLVLRGDRRRLTVHTTDVLLPLASGYQTRCPRRVEHPSRTLDPSHF